MISFRIENQEIFNRTKSAILNIQFLIEVNS